MWSAFQTQIDNFINKGFLKEDPSTWPLNNYFASILPAEERREMFAEVNNILDS